MLHNTLGREKMDENRKLPGIKDNTWRPLTLGSRTEGDPWGLGHAEALLLLDGLLVGQRVLLLSLSVFQLRLVKVLDMLQSLLLSDH